MKARTYLCSILISVIFLQFAQASPEGNKILLFPFHVGSHLIHFGKFAQDLKRQNYNVSILMVEDSKYRKEIDDAGVHLVPYPGFNQSYIDKSLGSQETKEGRIMDFLELIAMPLACTKNDPNWVQFIKNQEYDLLFREFMPHQNDLAHILGIPKNILIIPAAVDSWHLAMNIRAPFHSTTVGTAEEMFVPLPRSIDDDPGRSNFLTRFKSFLGKFPVQLIFGFFLHRQSMTMVSEDYQHLLGQHPLTDLVIMTGVEGVLDQSSVPPHVKFVYPMAEEEKFAGSGPLPQLYTDFISQYQRTILVSFGSMVKPTREALQAILDLSNNVKDYGIIISLKAFPNVEDLHQELGKRSNILLKDWIPQRKLLLTGKISIFHTHGGFNSIMESLEGGVPMISTPLTESDQQGNCKRIPQNGYGFCMAKPSLDQYLKAIEIFEQNDFYQYKMKHVQQVIQQKMLDQKDMSYWVKQVLEIGTQHLVPRDTVHLNFFQLSDVDIHFAFFTFLLTLFLLCAYATKKTLQCCCSKKQPKFKPD